MAREYFAEKNRIKLPELLAPAGSPEALEAAIEAGADAVYFGAGDFNARMRAKNFSREELEAALRLCRQYGVRSYVTVNTRLRDSELSEAASLVADLYEKGADAFIVADMGVARQIRLTVPEAELHASTQVSGHSAEDAAVLREMGFSRMVCPRELSLGEITRLVKASPIEIEMFIHGAHCVSFSGQCMMSHALGGRSGNRGMCAQPCRLPFRMDGVRASHPLSLKDMCLAQSVPLLIESGVSSLKIEGRQKSPDYVYGAVSVYRRLLDENRGADAEEMERLGALFSRDGFTDGYLRQSYKGMLGVRGELHGAPEEKAPKHPLTRKIPLEARLTLRVGREAELFVTDGKRSATVKGDTVIAQPSKSPLDTEAARRNMSRLGGTAFELVRFELDADGESFFTLSAINKLRRQAVEVLCARTSTSEASGISDGGESHKSASERRRDADGTTEKAGTKRSLGKSRDKLYTAEFLSLSQVTEEAKGFFHVIYLPLEEAEKTREPVFAPMLYPLSFDGQHGELLERLKKYRESRGVSEVLVHGLGQAALVRRAGLLPVGSFRFNVTNSRAARAVLEYTENVCISPEAPLGLLKDTGERSSAVVYGRLPLMHTQRCMLSDGGTACAFGGAGGRRAEIRSKKQSFGDVSCDGRLCYGTLCDRKNTSFAVVGLPDCSNVIYNSVPIYMGDKMSIFEQFPCSRLHFIFSTETGKECDGIIHCYKKGSAPLDRGGIKRLR